MKETELAHIVPEAGLPRRQFLYSTMLLSVPGALALTGLPLPAVAATYQPPVRPHGGTVVNVRKFGAYGDGSHDDTAAFQRAINSLPSAGGTIDVPDGTYVIDPTRNVRLRSRNHLRMTSGAVLKAKRNSADRAYVLMIYKVRDVEISGGRIVGDRDVHIGTSGEWGHGIMVRGSTGVTVRDIHISKCWGDGISIGGAESSSAPTIRSSDVVIANVVCTGNRRMGLTIGRSRNVKVYDSEFSHTKGIAPECGIDIEPDVSDLGTAETIHIENCVMRNNNKNGILIYKRVYGVTLKGCTIERNGGYGIYTVSPIGGSMTSNYIQHNYWGGANIRVETRDYRLSGNRFKNNNTRKYGLKLYNMALTRKSGTSDKGSQLQVSPDCRNVTAGTNYFAVN